MLQNEEPLRVRTPVRLIVLAPDDASQFLHFSDAPNLLSFKRSGQLCTSVDLYQPHSDRTMDQVRHIVNVEALHHLSAMRLDGLNADLQGLSNMLRCVPLRNQSHNLARRRLH